MRIHNGLEPELYECAQMILHDQCPPKQEYYFCMKQEDDSDMDCTQCWSNYLLKLYYGLEAYGR